MSARFPRRRSTALLHDSAHRLGLLAIAALALWGAGFSAAAQATRSADPAPAHATPAHATPLHTHSVQVPGYYHARIGSLKVTALFDGAVQLPRAQLLGLPKRQINAQLQRRHVPENSAGLQTAVNAYLVQRDAAVVLVDAGTAHCFGEALGHVPGNLRAAGVRAEDVTDVLLTHAHPDHLCGVRDPQGRMVYPNATVWLATPEAEYWQSDANMAASPEAMKPLFKMVQAALAPYAAAGKLRRFGPHDALPLNARALDTRGHTPGHRSFVFDGGGGQSLLVWGDVLHYHAVQFALPGASFEADQNRAQATRSRRRMLAQAADGAWWVAGAHLPFPGVGHVRREGRPGVAFGWVPAEFTPLPAP